MAEITVKRVNEMCIESEWGVLVMLMRVDECKMVGVVVM